MFKLRQLSQEQKGELLTFLPPPRLLDQLFTLHEKILPNSGKGENQYKLRESSAALQAHVPEEVRVCLSVCDMRECVAVHGVCVRHSRSMLPGPRLTCL